jgi:ABC-2 type transport system permease protein
MNMNIFLRELKANRKALIIWSVCMFLFVLSGMSKYTAYSSGASSDIFDEMPSTLKALLGIGSFDVTTMSGFFAFLYPYLALTTGIHAVLLGNGIIAKEERDKTTEFLMVKPVSRSTILTSKLLVALLNVVIINLVTYISSIVMVAAYNKGKSISGEIAMFLLSMFIIQLIFLSIGALLSAFIRKPKASGALATSILFGSYVISKITDLTDSVNALNVLSPLKYFSYQKIVDGNGLSLVIVFLSLLLIAVCIVFTYIFYRKRDLSI